MSSKKTDKPPVTGAKKPGQKTGEKIKLKEFEGKKPASKTRAAGGSNEPAAKPQKPVKKNKRNVGFVSLLLATVIAALGGASLGIGGMKYLNRSDQTADNLRTALEKTQMQQVQSVKDMNALEKRLGALQSSARKNTVKRSALKDTVEGQKTAILALQEMAQDNEKPLPDYAGQIESLTKDLKALGSLQVDGGESFDFSALITRIDALETTMDQEMLTTFDARIAALEKTVITPVFPKPDGKPIELPEKTNPRNKDDVLAILIAEFPKKKMLEAVSTQEALAAQKPSWLQRTLSRHIKVRRNDAPDPRASIAAAEQALKNGDVSKALSLINNLNPPVRAIASNWRAAAKKASADFNF